jgi:site-specific DNA recombinase
MPKRAILLGRTSYDDRDTDGRNLQGQLDECREYALKKGYVIVAELTEDVRGVSGAILYTPELARALEMARAGEADVLVLRELDRLGRSLAKQLIVEQDFNEAGCEIEYVLGNYPATPEGGLMKHVGASVAEYERLKIAERTTRARRAAARAGSVLGHGRPPYGYRFIHTNGKSEFAVNEAEAQVVRLIFEWFTHDRVAIDGIARKLNEMGVPARRSGKWNRSVIHKMLQREAYAGAWYYGKHRWVNEGGRKRMVRNPKDYWISVAIPPIVERETWLLAQRQLQENRENASRRKKYDYLLTGHISCTCGGKVYGESRKQRNGSVILYYRCSKCDLPFFHASQVDSVAWEWVRALLLDPDALTVGWEAQRSAQGAEAEALRGRLAEIDAALARNRAKQKKLLDLFLADEFPREVLIERNEDLETVISAQERERATVVAEIEAQALTEAQMEDWREFAARVAEKLIAADSDFQARREIILILGVRVILSVEGGQRVVRTTIDIAPTISGYSTSPACSLP